MSYLYVPADAGRRLTLADTRGADAVIADLEDAVAPGRRAQARQEARAWLSRSTGTRVERWVRINSGPDGLEDLAEVFGPGLSGVCIPKVTCPNDVQQVTRLLTELETAHRRSDDPVPVMPLVESGAGLIALPGIARAPRVQRLQLGELDLAADLGMEPGPDETELLAARTAVVTASAAARLLPPVGAVRADLADHDALDQSTRRLRRLGFLGRAAIHPAQLPVIHAVFDVTPEQVHVARSLVSAYDQALAAGQGVLRDEHGRMVDEAVVRRSRHIISLAAQRKAHA
ncbi:CoA ester lyase [Micromonospora echinofusca]|uniref:CoA ester lyase n=1 Tax=Micromonospora echinofusca TaxID=47858 RepID=A0ABS3VW49_MICEH|nr:CoA ester lyase [Micromonospora echinofusca]